MNKSESRRVALGMLPFRFECPGCGEWLRSASKAAIRSHEGGARHTAAFEASGRRYTLESEYRRAERAAWNAQQTGAR